MFGSQIIHSVVAFLDYDPAADDQIPVFIAPAACEITAAKVMTTNTIAADGTNYFGAGLVNKGGAGNGSGVIAPAVGGESVAWTALVPKPFTISGGTLAAGDVVALDYNENGTGTFTSLMVQIDYVLGQG